MIKLYDPKGPVKVMEVIDHDYNDGLTIDFEPSACQEEPKSAFDVGYYDEDFCSSGIFVC